MAVFQVYYDASGAESRPGMVVVLGLIATEKKWRRFDQLWEAVLHDYKVSHLHMKHFTAGRGEFASWYEDRDKRAAFVQRIVRALKLGVNKGFLTAVSRETIDTIGARFSGMESSYMIAANLTRRTAERWIAKVHPKSSVHHVFEKGDAGQSLLPILASIDGKFDSFAIVPKVTPSGQRIRAFEGADFLAWEARRLMEDNAVGKFDVRKSVREIGRMLPIAGHKVQTERLLAICASRPDLFPPKNVSASDGSS